MGRLRLYANEQGDTAVHESGFSWLAAISLPAWALQRRLYGLAAVSLLAILASGALAARSGLGEGWQLGLYATGFVAGGYLASHLQAWLLRRRGWFVSAEESLPKPRPPLPTRP